MSAAPVRYSIDEDLDRPCHERIGHLLAIFCDGVPIRLVLRYDIEAGEIERMVIDARGYVMSDPRRPGETLTQIIRGKIEAKILSEATYG